MLVVLVVAVAGIGLGILIARLVLSGLLSMAFKRARSAIRRLVQRRKAPREETPDRRSTERRN